MQSGAGKTYQDGVLGALMASGAGFARQDGVLGAVMASGPGYARQDGMLGTVFEAAAGMGAVMQSGRGRVIQDGSLGAALAYEAAAGMGVAHSAPMRGAASSFRDGVFSTSDPVAAYQQYNQQAFADGVLGTEMALPSPAAIAAAVMADKTKKMLTYAGIGIGVLVVGYFGYKKFGR